MEKFQALDEITQWVCRLPIKQRFRAPNEPRSALVPKYLTLTSKPQDLSVLVRFTHFSSNFSLRRLGFALSIAIAVAVFQL